MGTFMTHMECANIDTRQTYELHPPAFVVPWIFFYTCSLWLIFRTIDIILGCLGFAWSCFTMFHNVCYWFSSNCEQRRIITVDPGPNYRTWDHTSSKVVNDSGAPNCISWFRLKLNEWEEQKKKKECSNMSSVKQWLWKKGQDVPNDPSCNEQSTQLAGNIPDAWCSLQYFLF